ncbi:uncharacterized protein J3D65DRAFT_311455 [Phyllosticta citribraziliensis]|uniref:C2H2-type domain-containing protein n=1 Tax=Phyllosticta citribraziliensis TaxID=989973 RepID=A0ABR1LS84_9PEZI
MKRRRIVLSDSDSMSDYSPPSKSASASASSSDDDEFKASADSPSPVAVDDSSDDDEFKFSADSPSPMVGHESSDMASLPDMQQLEQRPGALPQHHFPARRTHVEGHRRTVHRREKLFACVCGKKYTRDKNMKRHQRATHCATAATATATSSKNSITAYMSSAGNSGKNAAVSPRSAQKQEEENEKKKEEEESSVNQGTSAAILGKTLLDAIAKALAEDSNEDVKPNLRRNVKRTTRNR